MHFYDYDDFLKNALPIKKGAQVFKQYIFFIILCVHNIFFRKANKELLMYVKRAVHLLRE